MKTKLLKKGQSLIEVLLSVVIVSLTLVALVASIVAGMRNNRLAKNSALANQYAQEALELARQTRDQATSWDDWQSSYSGCLELDASLNWHSGCSWNDPDGYCTGSNQIGIFTRCLYFNNDTDKTEITVRVVWSESNRFHKAETATILTKWNR